MSVVWGEGPEIRKFVKKSNQFVEQAHEDVGDNNLAGIDMLR